MRNKMVFIYTGLIVLILVLLQGWDSTSITSPIINAKADSGSPPQATELKPEMLPIAAINSQSDETRSNLVFAADPVQAMAEAAVYSEQGYPGDQQIPCIVCHTEPPAYYPPPHPRFYREPPPPLGYYPPIPSPAPDESEGSTLDSQLRSMLSGAGISTLDPGPTFSPAQINLGKALFFDKELSGNRDISCATCHHPFLNSSDGLSVSIGTGTSGLGPTRLLGADRSFIPRNAPEIFNRAAPEWSSMFWDSRVKGTVDTGFVTPAKAALPDGLESVLAAQAMFPVTSGDEMRGAAGDVDVFGQANELAVIDDEDLPEIWAALMERLMAIPEYVTLFQKAYPNVPTSDFGFHHAANAIAAFEAKTFTFLDSPWDRYVAGNDTVLSTEAKQGAILFYGEANCVRCHAGNLFTDQEHHNIGVPQLGPGKGDESPLDFGFGRESNEASDRFKFRTPPLRNVLLTGPWMHNGAYASLEDAVEHYIDREYSLRNYDISQLDPKLQTTVQRDEATLAAILETVDPELQNAPPLSDAEVDQLMAFLNALTSPTAAGLLGEVPYEVPSGLPIGD